MNYKQYRNFRIITAMLLAAVMSQAVIFNNYILAIFAVIAAMAVMFTVKKKVVDVLADERDYQNAGKAARYSLGIFSALGAVLTMFFMFQRSVDPAYEIIGSTLAYSVCGLLLLNSIVFMYYAKQN